MPVISTEQATTSFSSFLANFSASFLKYFHLTFFYTITTIFQNGELMIMTIHVENLKWECSSMNKPYTHHWKEKHYVHHRANTKSHKISYRHAHTLQQLFSVMANKCHGKGKKTSCFNWFSSHLWNSMSLKNLTLCYWAYRPSRSANLLSLHNCYSIVHHKTPDFIHHMYVARRLKSMQELNSKPTLSGTYVHGWHPTILQG